MPRADEMSPADPVEARVISFYTLLMKKDFAAWSDLFADDAKQENPFMPSLDGLDSGFDGRDRIVFHYKTVLENRRGLVFTIDAIHQTEGGECAIVEVGGRSEVPETGRIYDQRYVWIFRFRDGKIVGMREYFNPLAFEKAFKGFLVGEGAVAN